MGEERVTRQWEPGLRTEPLRSFVEVQSDRWASRDNELDGIDPHAIDLFERTFHIPLDLDGWSVSGSWQLSETRGVEICDLHIRPSPYADDHDTRRGPSDIPEGGLNSYVLRSVNVGGIRETIHSRIVERNEGAEGFFQYWEEHGQGEAVRKLRQTMAWRMEAESRSAELVQSKGGAPRKYSEKDRARWAEDVLSDLAGNPGNYRGELARRWDVGSRTIGKRITDLRRVGWLTGTRTAIEAGPRLISWRLNRKDS